MRMCKPDSRRAASLPEVCTNMIMCEQWRRVAGNRANRQSRIVYREIIRALMQSIVQVIAPGHAGLRPGSVDNRPNRLPTLQRTFVY